MVSGVCSAATPYQSPSVRSCSFLPETYMCLASNTHMSLCDADHQAASLPMEVVAAEAEHPLMADYHEQTDKLQQIADMYRRARTSILPDVANWTAGPDFLKVPLVEAQALAA